MPRRFLLRIIRMINKDKAENFLIHLTIFPEIFSHISILQSYVKIKIELFFPQNSLLDSFFLWMAGIEPL